MSKFSFCVGAWKSKHQHERRTQAEKKALFRPATPPRSHKFRRGDSRIARNEGKSPCKREADSLPLRYNKKSLPYLFAFELSKANAKAESLTLRANMSRAAVPRRVVCARTNGFQRRSLWRGNVCLFATANKQTCDFGLPKSAFFRHFFVERQRNGIQKPTAQRAPQARCMSARLHKLQKNLVSPTPTPLPLDIPPASMLY